MSRSNTLGSGYGDPVGAPLVRPSWPSGAQPFQGAPCSLLHLDQLSEIRPVVGPHRVEGGFAHLADVEAESH